MNNNNYNDDSFSPYQAYSYTLLLQVEATSFSYAVIHQNNLLITAQNCSLDELAHPKQLSDLLTATYKKVVIGLPSTGLTLVPKNLVNEEYIGGFARLLDVQENEKVIAQTLDNDNVIVFKANEELVSAAERFNLQNAVYSATGWVKAIAATTPPNNYLYIQVNNNTVQMLNFSLGKIRFFNTFDYAGGDDLVYFVTLVANELQLTPQIVTIVLSGEISTRDASMKRLADFYPKIEINSLKPIELPGQIISHKFLALAALFLCESSAVL
jgi:hypothetical protein